MILIADSGATKTDWLVADKHSENILIHTSGINPFHQSEEKIHQIIKEELLASGKIDPSLIQHIFFYGSGCLPETSPTVEKALRRNFSQPSIFIESDLLGAARAACNRTEGIACILGTGSNSCLYDGKHIRANVSPLGYILGDEGSGAYIGKRFIGNCFKQQLPSNLCEGLLNEYHLTRTDILNKVYKEPQANRFLASITPYIYSQKDNPFVHDFLVDCFEQFFRRNVLLYKSDLPVSFVGSIAWFFHEELKEAAKNHNITIRSIIRQPINGLVEYHKDDYQ